MKQWITDYTGVQNLKQESAPVPQPGEGEVLVKVHTVSINFRDIEGAFRKCSCSEPWTRTHVHADH